MHLPSPPSNKLSRIEKLGLALRDDRISLNDQENEYLNLCKRAFAIMCTHMDQQVRINMIQRLNYSTLSTAKAIKIMNDTKELFADVVKINKKFTRMVRREKYLDLYNKALAEGDIGEARRCLDKADNIDGLHDGEENIDPFEFDLPDTYLTTDPKAFYEDAEAINFEEE